jgi:zinc/manganese transport system substrate-binding protein
MRKLALCVVTAILLLRAVEAYATSQAVSIVAAAENFYGDVPQQLAGPNTRVTSILSNSNQDPHPFEAHPSIPRNLSMGVIIVYNGAGYDPWMAKPLSVSPAVNRQVIIAAVLVHKNAGYSPHVSYYPAMPAYADAVARALTEGDRAHRPDFDQRLQTLLAPLQPLAVASRSKVAGRSVTATEPEVWLMRLLSAISQTLSNPQ